jgi:hypothetical protein
MRSSARNPANAAARTIVKSEIGRFSANDTKFIVQPQPVARGSTTERATKDADKTAETSLDQDVEHDAGLVQGSPKPMLYSSNRVA